MVEHINIAKDITLPVNSISGPLDKNSDVIFLNTSYIVYHFYINDYLWYLAVIDIAKHELLVLEEYNSEENGGIGVKGQEYYFNKASVYGDSVYFPEVIGNEHEISAVALMRIPLNGSKKQVIFTKSQKEFGNQSGYMEIRSFQFSNDEIILNVSCPDEYLYFYKIGINTGEEEFLGNIISK